MEETCLCVLSYNVLFDHENDQGRTWDKRKESLFDVVRNRQPDVCGFQECLPASWWSYQYSEMRDWRGYFANATKEEGAYGNNIIIGKNDSILKVGGARPYKENDQQGNNCAEFVSQKFALKSNGREFRVFNCHLQPPKTNVSDIYKEVVKDEPTIIMGDFNGTPELGSGFQNCRLIAKQKVHDKMCTFVGQNTFERKNTEGPILDHILVSEHFSVLYYETINDHQREDSSKIPSDHRAVYAKLLLQ